MKLRFLKSLLRISILLCLSCISLTYLIKRPSLVWSIDDQSQQYVDSDILKTHVKILSENYLPRDYYHPQNLDLAASYIQSNFEKYNSDTYLQSYSIKNNTFSNVISNYGPDTDEIIIIGAHYDAYSSHPGADDNASGVAGLLELGRLLSVSTLNKRIVLVAYTCEEPPQFATQKMGSFIHANSISNKAVRLMISLEMIGYYSDDKGSQDYPLLALNYIYPNTGDFIAVVGQVLSSDASDLKNTINRNTSLDAYSINAPSVVVGVDFSDHRNYWALDYPAVMVTDTAFFRNKHYHKSSDTYEKLNYANMAKVVYGVYMHVQSL